MNANATEIRDLRTVLDTVGQHAQNLQRDYDSIQQVRDLLLTENDSLANTKAFLLGEIKAVQASRIWSLIHRLRNHAKGSLTWKDLRERVIAGPAIPRTLTSAS